MNETSKDYMQKVKGLIVEGLETNFPLIPLFEDEVPEEETTKYDNGLPYHLMVMKFGPIDKQENEKYLTQSFSVALYAENKSDVDETTLDIITVTKSVPSVRFAGSDKFRARHAQSNRYVDIVTMNFVRMMKVEC